MKLYRFGNAHSNKNMLDDLEILRTKDFWADGVHITKWISIQCTTTIVQYLH